MKFRRYPPAPQDMHLSTQQNLAQAMDDTGLPCAVMLDILGTEVVVINRCTQPQSPQTRYQLITAHGGACHVIQAQVGCSTQRRPRGC